VTVPGTIVIHVGSRELRVPEGNVYFAFGDGRFRYECATCDARCCKGHGLGLDVDLLKVYLRTKPGLAMFVRGEACRARVSLDNYQPGCFFLNGDNKCSVHNSLGSLGKPESCRFFPFNGLWRLSDYLVVYPHLSLCPLEVVLDTRYRHSASRHGTLIAGLAADGIRGPVPASALGRTTVNRLVSLERQILADAEARIESADQAGFLETQARLTAEVFPEISAQAVFAPERFGEALTSVIGLDPGRRRITDEAAVRTLIACTPALRVMILIRTLGAGNGGIDNLPRIPRLLKALHVVAEIALDVGLRRLTLQGAAKLLTDHWDLLQLLADIDRPMTPSLWARLGVLSRDARRRPGATTLGAPAGGGTLGAALSDMLPTDQVARLQILRRVSINSAERAQQTRSTSVVDNGNKP
jgi:hypothetical protein